MRSRWCQAFCIGPETTSPSSTTPPPSAKNDSRALASIMKRRNVVEGKSRRPAKRTNKISESFCGSALIFGKLLALWGTVLLADHFLDFRFEYLWPLWLFLRSVYDSFKYQGMAFSVFFVCISLTSDMICFLFIPLPWLFFAASTFVWVQYVWHTEKGVCIPTVLFWVLLVYIEAFTRLKEFKAYIDLKQLPFHLDLCRPFAAHCIGYPVVTLGFSFKSNVGDRMRQRRQKEVQKENEYFYQFLKEALPPGIRDDAFNHDPCLKRAEERISDGAATLSSPNLLTSNAHGRSSPTADIRNGSKRGSNENLNAIDNSSVPSTLSTSFAISVATKLSNGGTHHSNGSPAISLNGTTGSNGDLDYIEKIDFDDKRASKTSTREVAKRNRDSSKMSKEDQVNPIAKMEADLKKYKIDLQMARNKENELRDQIVSSAANERLLKSDISNLQVEKSLLETRIASLQSIRAGEKATLSSLEKKLADERKQKAEYQIKLESERRNKKEASNAQQIQTRSEVTKLEAEIRTLRHELQVARVRCEVAEQGVFALRQYKETHGDPEILATAVKNLQEQILQLETSLSSETKLKMDLFSALGEAKRELSIAHALVSLKDNEIFNLKAKVADVLAVMPGGNPRGGMTTTNSVVGSGLGSSSIYTSSTLSLDLPASTYLSFTGKMPNLGSSDNNDSLTSSGIYSPAVRIANSPAFPVSKTNGNTNGDKEDPIF